MSVCDSSPRSRLANASLRWCKVSLNFRPSFTPRALARARKCKFLNNVIEQVHRTVKKRTWLAKGYNTFRSAWRTLEGIETVNMIRKGRVKWITKGDAGAQARFVAK